MRLTSSRPISMTSQFRRNYFIASVIPFLLLLALSMFGATIAKNHLADLITESTYALNHDTQLHLRKLGEQIIQTKARDVAKQLENYFQMHPDIDITEMRKDPLFMEIAIQKVGSTGYTIITEASDSYLFRAHPNEQFIDRDMRFLKDKMPALWKIMQEAINGDEVSGYYDWTEPDGSTREKFLATAPIKVPLKSTTMMVSATTYIDEFSLPIVRLYENADAIGKRYQNHVSRQWLIFSVISIIMLLLAFVGTYYFGSRAALQHIQPIVRLAQKAREFGEGKSTVDDKKEIFQRKDEIGELAQTLHRMAGQEADLFKRLELQLTQLNDTQAALKKSEAHYKELYEESQKAQEVYRSLIHSSADAIVIYDIDARVTYTSPMFTQIFGWTMEELMGQRIPYLPESEKSAAKKIFTTVIEKGLPCHDFETKRLTKWNQVIDVSISVSRYDDHQGQPAGMLLILRDISEKKRIEAHVQSLERMEAIGTLAGGIAHDFNNLLMVIQGSVGLLKKRMDSRNPDFAYLTKIESQTHRGSRLTSQLLGYARKGRYEVKVANLNEIITDSTETFHRTRKDIRAHYHLAENLSPIEADVDQIEQVLLNLFINASDAMPDGGDLTITTRNIIINEMDSITKSLIEKQYVIIQIEDTGIGMSPKTMERMFDPFFTTKEMGRGTGLGLASVYGIIDGHKGHIDVESIESQGTIFKIYLPASDKTVELIQTESYNITPGEGTILLIDDEQIILQIGSDILNSIGYQVITADSGDAAIQIYETQTDKIDLVILDMIMPGMSGSEVFDHLIRINRNVAVLLSSGYSIDGKAEDIIKRGCKGFIQKPYSIEQISEKINEVLGPQKTDIAPIV